MRDGEIEALQNNYREVLEQAFQNAEKYKNQVITIINSITGEDQKTRP